MDSEYPVGRRLVVGQWTLDPPAEVRILPPQLSPAMTEMDPTSPLRIHLGRFFAEGRWASLQW
jgi:hypothetical protein